MDIEQSLQSWVSERKSETLRIFSLPIENSGKKIELKHKIKDDTITLTVYESKSKQFSIEFTERETINQVILTLELLKRSAWGDENNMT